MSATRTGQRPKQLGDAKIEAEVKAWDALSRYKFLMFGYWAAQWVLVNSLEGGGQTSNPFKNLVLLAREHLRRLR